MNVYKEKNQKNKLDAGKPRLDLLPTEALVEIAKCFEHGLKNYGERSWETDGKVECSRLYSATLRHLFSWWRGENYDKDSSLKHLVHVATNAVMLLTYAVRSECNMDDRPKSLTSKKSWTAGVK